MTARGVVRHGQRVYDTPYLEAYSKAVAVSRAMRNAVRCRLFDTVAGRRSGVPYLFILMGGRLPKRVMLKRVACTRTRSHSRRRQ